MTRKHWWWYLSIFLVMLVFVSTALAMEPDESDQDDGQDSGDEDASDTPPVIDQATTVETIPLVINDEEGDTANDEGEDGIIADGLQSTNPSPDSLLSPSELPFADVSDADFQKLLQENPTALGAMSIGFTNSGALMGGIQMPEDPRWHIVNPRETWGTQETIEGLRTAIITVNDAFPNTPPLNLGDISDEDGGRLNRHVSHQAGRDADVGFYFTDGSPWYTPGNHGTLDLPRNWALVRAFVVHSDIEIILLDSRIQRELYEYALSIGEDPAWLATIFQYPNGNRQSIVRHARGHGTHYHVRFYNPRAQELGRRAYPVLLAAGKVKPPTFYTYHRARKGDTLGGIARRYHTSVAALKRANGLRSNNIRAGRSYRVACRGGVSRVPGPLSLPARRLPPSTPVILAQANWAPKGFAVPMIRRQLTITTDNAGRRIASLMTVTFDVAPQATQDDQPAQANAEAGADAAKSAAMTAKVGKKQVGSGSRISYRVRSGDNLWSIAHRHGLNVKDIKRWNGLHSESLKPGQRLVLYTKKK